MDSDKIKQLRISKSWSQEKLAAASGLSLRTIQRIENEGVCSLESKQAIAATFQVEPSNFDTEPTTRVFIDQNLSDSKFDDINLANTEFSNTNLRGAKFININLSHTFFRDINLSNAEITDANISGMKVFGYLLTDLIEHYEKSQAKK
ncbi:MAG: pentapeptide repeat-containing protein [Endozoicomonas sp.]|uniref:pentapeptide repeat-containing protein n=1 Tax=Endozoicomonas sp. TaxID=1892382 RepID=UPI003D9BD8C2